MVGRKDLLYNKIIYFLLTFTLIFSPFSTYFAYAEDHLVTEVQSAEEDADQWTQDAKEEAEVEGLEQGEENLESADENSLVEDVDESADLGENVAEDEEAVEPVLKPSLAELTNINYVVSMKLVNFPDEQLTALEYCVPRTLGGSLTWYKSTDDVGSPNLLDLYIAQDSMTTGELSFVPVDTGSAGRYLGLRYRTASGGDVWVETEKPFAKVPELVEIPMAPISQAFRPEAGLVNMLMVTFDKPMAVSINEEMTLTDFAEEIAVNNESIGDLTEGKVTWITKQVAKVVFPATPMSVGDVLTIKYQPEHVIAANGLAIEVDLQVDPCVEDTFGPVGKIVVKTGTVSTLDVVFNEPIPSSSRFGSASTAIDSITLGDGESDRRTVKADTLSWSKREGRDVMTIRFASPEKVGETEYFKIEYTDRIKDYAGNSIDAEPKAVAIGGAIGLSDGDDGALKGTTPILNSIRELAGGKTPKVAILSSSDVSYQSGYDYFYENTAGAQAAYAFALFGFEPVIGEITHDTYRDEVIISRTKDAFADCTVIFGPGGDQARNSRAYLNDDGSDTELMRDMRQVFYSGGVISGTSAGDHSLSSLMLAGGANGGAHILSDEVLIYTVDQYNKVESGDRPSLMPGYGFLHDIGLTDSHFDARNRLPRLLVAMKHSGQHVGIGVSENTGISIKNGMGYVYGVSYVLIADDTDAEYVESDIYAVRNLRLSVLTEGDCYDFNRRKVVSSKGEAAEEGSIPDNKDIFTKDGQKVMRDLVRSKQVSTYGTDKSSPRGKPTPTVVFIKDGQTEGYYNTEKSYAVSNMLVCIDVFERLSEMQSYAAPPPKPSLEELTNIDYLVSMKLVNFPDEPLTALEYCVLQTLDESPKWYKSTDDAGSPNLLDLYIAQDSMTTGELSFVPDAAGSADRYLGLRYQTTSGGDTWVETAKPFSKVPEMVETPTPPVSQAFRPEAGLVNMLMVTFDKPMAVSINEEMTLANFAEEITVNDQSIGDLTEGKVTWITKQVAKVVFPATLMRVGDELTIKYKADQVKAENGLAIETDLQVDPCVADTFGPVGKVVPRTGSVSEIEIVFNELIALESKRETAASTAISVITLGTSKEHRSSVTPTTLSWSMRDGRDVLTVGLGPVDVGETEYFEVTYTNLIKDYSGNPVDGRPKSVAIGGGIGLSSGTLAGTTPILNHIRELAGGKTPKVAILSSSDSPYEESYDYFYENTSGAQAAYGFALFGFEPVIAEITCDTYNDDEIIERTMKAFEDCTAVFGPGGDQSMNSRAYLEDDGSDTELMRGMRQVFHSGGVISGSSAGDHSLSNPMISGGTSSGALIGDAVDVITVAEYENQGTNLPLIIPGFGFVSDYGLTDSHVDARSRLGRLLVALKHTDQQVGIGVGENTSIAIVDGIGQVFGAAGVMITDVSKATYPQSEIYAVRNARLNYLTAGDKYDFNTKKMISAKPKAEENESGLSPSSNIFPGSLAGSRTTGIEALIRDLIRNTSDTNYGTDSKDSLPEAKTATLVIKKDSQTLGYYDNEIQYAVGSLLLNVDVYEKLDEMLKYESPDPGPGPNTSSSKSRNKKNIAAETVVDDPAIPLAPIPTAGFDFRDVTKTHWAYEQVKYLAERGYVAGKTDVLFAPSDQITRAEFITILARMSGDVLPNSYSGPFADIVSGSYYEEAVAWGVNAGVIKGVSATAFSPKNQIQRQEMASMILRYAEFKHYALPQKSEAITFSDQAQIHEYAREAVATMQQAGIINGDEDGSFRPLRQATRAEAAKMLAMVHQLMTGMER